MDGPFPAVVQAVRRFFGWWLGELAGLLPAPVRGVFRPAGAMLMIDLSTDDPAFSVWDGRRREQLGRVDRSRLAAGKVGRPLRAILRKARSGRAAITACLPADRVLVRRLTLPDAALTDIRQALRFQIDRLTPFAESDACFDYRLIRQDTANKRIDVDLVVAPRADVDAAVATASAWGMPPDRVDIAGHDPTRGPELNLLAEREGPQERAARPHAPTMLKVLAAALVVAAVYIPLDRLQTRADLLAAQAASARKGAEITAMLREKITDELAADNFIAEKRRAALSQVRILDELTRLLGDDVWLIQYHKNDTTIRLSGFAPAAGDLIQVIDGSDLFLTPKFIAPVTKDPTGGGDRFSISFDFEEPES